MNAQVTILEALPIPAGTDDAGHMMALANQLADSIQNNERLSSKVANNIRETVIEAVIADTDEVISNDGDPIGAWFEYYAGSAAYIHALDKWGQALAKVGEQRFPDDKKKANNMFATTRMALRRMVQKANGKDWTCGFKPIDGHYCVTPSYSSPDLALDAFNEAVKQVRDAYKGDTGSDELDTLIAKVRNAGSDLVLAKMMQAK